MKQALWLAVLLILAASAQAAPTRKSTSRKASRGRAAGKATFNPSRLNTSSSKASVSRSATPPRVPSRAFARYAGETPESGPAPTGGALIQTGAAWKVAPGSEEKINSVEGNGLIAEEGPRGQYLTKHRIFQDDGTKDKLPPPTPTGNASGGNSVKPNQ